MGHERRRRHGQTAEQASVCLGVAAVEVGDESDGKAVLPQSEEEVPFLQPFLRVTGSALRACCCRSKLGALELAAMSLKATGSCEAVARAGRGADVHCGAIRPAPAAGPVNCLPLNCLIPASAGLPPTRRPVAHAELRWRGILHGSRPGRPRVQGPVRPRHLLLVFTKARRAVLSQRRQDAGGVLGSTPGAGSGSECVRACAGCCGMQRGECADVCAG